MTLNFFNQSRSFNETKRQVRFWGYDGVLEISFDVEVEALQKINGLSPVLAAGEARILEAFDNSLEKIQQVAAKISTLLTYDALNDLLAKHPCCRRPLQGLYQFREGQRMR